MIKNIELLAPAGDMTKLKTAILYGADAVYLAGKSFGLRAFAGNFSDKELQDAVEFAHSKGKKVYVTLNIFARNSDFKGIKQYAIFLDTIGVDAVIVSDLGVMRLVKENTNLEIHISTQANVVNKFTAMEYVKLGAKRIILARECTLTEIKEIADHVKGKAEIEVFIHGAMCVSYSGRCTLSNYLTNRDANRGACAQPCRWKYALMEEKREGEYFPIEEDSSGTYIMNSRDLCLINHMKEIAEAGVVSFKIEGRMKSDYYVAGVVNAYRRAMSGEKFDFICELERISNRRYTTGFMFNGNAADSLFTEKSSPIQSHEIMAVVVEVLGMNKNNNCDILIEQRNNFAVMDEMEILSPQENFNKKFKINSLKDKSGQSVDRAKLVQGIYQIECPYQLYVGDILRKRII